MLSGAMTVTEAQSARGSSITIAGKTGVGKTALAALFPKPFLIRLEDGLQSIEHLPDVQVTPKIEKVIEVTDWIERLRTEKHNRITAIFDSMTVADAMGENEIVARDNATNLNAACGGYGAGARILARKMQEIREQAARLQDERGMNVIFVAQSQIDTIRPENSEPYDVLDLQMNPKSRPPFTADVDVVAFLRLKTDTEQAGKDRKIAVSSGRREIVCYAHVALASKNRLGITDVLRCPPGTNPLLEIIEERQAKMARLATKKPSGSGPEEVSVPEEAPEAPESEEEESTSRDWL